jgi:hypothetical protein
MQTNFLTLLLLRLGKLRGNATAVAHTSMLQISGSHNVLILINKSLITKSNSNLLKRMIGSLNIVPIRQSRGEEAKASNDNVVVASNSGKSQQ